MLAYARGLAHWHRGHRFCGLVRHRDSGHPGRPCAALPNCGRAALPAHRPRGDRAGHHGDQCLLGRSPRFPPGMYSTLAGFVEPGELLEQTLRREVFEEVGVTIDDMAYRASQPWPFPQSLMLGFRARAPSIRAGARPRGDRGCRLVRPGRARATRIGGRCACRTATASPASCSRNGWPRRTEPARAQAGSAAASGSAVPCSRNAAVRANRSRIDRRRAAATAPRLARAGSGWPRSGPPRSALRPSGRISTGNPGPTAK